MQIVGQTVKHKAFGQGTITNCSGNIVTVSFSQGDKRFIYPDAFIDFLTLQNKSVQNKIDILCNERLEAKAAYKQALKEEQKRRQRLQTLKITPNSQAAFHLDIKDLDTVFSTGAVSTGCYLSGNSKGKPRVPSKLMPNSACLLTGRAPNAAETERRILGAFMVTDDFLGDLCKNGMVRCHERYKVTLPPGVDLLYWDYFDFTGPLPRWGSAAFRYVATGAMQRVLLDIREALRGSEQEAIIGEFYRHFSEINRLPQ